MHDSNSLKIWSRNENIHFDTLVNWHGKTELIPVNLENNIVNFYLRREVKSTETNNENVADHYLAKNCQQSAHKQCARKFIENSESRCGTHW